MSRSAKDWGALFAVPIFLTAAYLLTFGRCFFPLPNPSSFVSEPLEFRMYSPFALPLQSHDFEGAWVGTVSKIDGALGVISSKSFYGYQLPAPDWVAKTVKSAFK